MKNTGTTTLGMKYKDGIVLAADMRMSIGGFIDNDTFDKIVPINDNMALTVAGSVSGVQLMVKYLKSELKLRQIKTGRESTTKECANLLRNYVFSMVQTPFTGHFLMAGSDSYGNHLYDVFPDGSLNEVENYKVSGSGMFFAHGVLQSKFKKDMSEAEAIKLAEEVIDVAIQRDSHSGDGLNVYVVNKNGVKKVLTKKVNTHLQ